VPLRDHVAAISCGISNGVAVLDLDYVEDSACEVDANFVLTGANAIVEVQGTAERDPFAKDQLLAMLGLAEKGIGELVALQKKAIAAWAIAN
jgi:ribonuclease PH